MKNQKKAYIYALTAILFWSTVASAFKITLARIDYALLLFYASLTSLTALTVIIILQKKIRIAGAQSLREILNSALLGFLNPFLYYIILFKAYSILPAQEAMTLNYVWPIMLVLLSIPILRERVRALTLFSVFVSFFGVMIIATGGNISSLHFSNPFGVTLALSSSVIWALFWLFNARDSRDETVKLFINFIFGFIYILIYNVLTESLRIPSGPALAGGIYIGLFEMGITFVLWSLAMRYTSSTAAIGSLIFLSPFISLFLISILVEETIEISTIAGLMLIITGIAIEKCSKK